MKKTVSKIYAFLGTMAIMLTTGISPVLAAVGYDPDKYNGTTENVKTQGVVNWVDTVVNIVSIVGSGIAIIALIVLGIKYMMGSVEEKAEYKKTMLPYLIGAVFVFGAAVLVKVIYTAMTNA